MSKLLLTGVRPVHVSRYQPGGVIPPPTIITRRTPMGNKTDRIATLERQVAALDDAVWELHERVDGLRRRLEPLPPKPPTQDTPPENDLIGWAIGIISNVDGDAPADFPWPHQTQEWRTAARNWLDARRPTPPSWWPRSWFATHGRRLVGTATPTPTRAVVVTTAS